VMITACVALEVCALVVFDAGLVGVAWGCSIPMAAVSALFLPAHFNRRMGISFGSTVLQSWLPATLACLPGIALLLGWNTYHRPDSWIELISIVVIVGILTAAGAWCFALRAAERARIRRMLPF